jgi:hypothetical protein
MIDIGTWTDKAERRVTMALEETVKQLEYEANALWKGKRVCGETRLGSTRTPYDGPIHRVAVSHYEDPNEGPCVSVAFLAMVAFPEGEVEMYVRDPRLPDETTP